MRTADLQPHLLQNPGHGVPDGRRGGKAQIHNAERRIQTAAGLSGHQLAHAGHLKRRLFHGLRHHIQRLALYGLQGVVHHAGAGDAHVDDLLRLAHAVERAGHEGVILHGVAEDHQLGAAEAVPVRCPSGGFLDNFTHEGHGVHIDASPCGTHIDAGAYQLRAVQRLRDGADQLFIRPRHTLLHQRGVAADEVDAASLGCPIQRQRKGYIVLRLAGPGHQRHRRYGNPLVDNGDSELPLDILAGFYQLFRVPGNFFINLIAGPSGIRITAAQK